ncbi:MAG: isochorismatase family protein [Planctomycetes bacterium]|nr:isochorismatase family protein [Planctomycetota bacterium]
MAPVLMVEADLAAVVVIDFQEKMLRAIGTSPNEALAKRIGMITSTARLLGVPVLYTEQNPKGLGATDASLAGAVDGATGPLIKTTCSCWRDEGFRTALQRTEREHVILCGLETHVCIQQTALDLLRVDYVPIVPMDAVGSRFQSDYDAAANRMRAAGVLLTTTESLLFELIERCDHPRFKEFLQIVK